MVQTRKDIRTVTTTAFVMPMFDIRSREDGTFLYIPTEKAPEFYNVYVWNFNKQRWVFGETFEVHEEALARKYAFDYHTKMAQKYNFYV